MSQKNDELLREKIAAGLTKAQALAVIADQDEHDATDPHDLPPDPESDQEPAPKSKKKKATADQD